MNKYHSPFWTIVRKEVADHVRSWRFLILIGIIALTCMGSLYTALTNIGAAIKPNDPDGSFLFLKLFTVSDGTLPSFTVFVSFLGPLLGIALGFDAINSEQNKGTLSRILSQPIHRDYLINAKFVGALIVIGVMLFVLGFLVMGFRADQHRYSSNCRRIFTGHRFYPDQYLLCGFLAESFDLLFDQIPSGCNFRPGLCRHLVVLQYFL